MQRRHFLQATAFGSSLWFTPGLFAELTQTPRMTEGPFYPDNLPLDKDNDLVIVDDSLTPAVGQITHLTGRVLTPSGQPVRNAVIEIWQCDNNGAYLHTGTNNNEGRDKNFQGYGQFVTDSAGAYRFRTIKPVPYPGRTPHIHVAVSRHGERVLTTQLFVKGAPENEQDGILKSIQNPKALANVIREFKPVPNTNLGELAVHFDVILGLTPHDPNDEEVSHGIGKSDRASGRGMGPGGPRGPGRGRPDGPPPPPPRP
ncbi:intradiol ring-cleavage dioxygenase [Planctomicrobium sp. SH661]|uniref:dioxygenase family protein n=1 Tax=Planctomicrobium sp. SH661 TaxID=3448124 RepID=UPI003F5C6866